MAKFFNGLILLSLVFFNFFLANAFAVEFDLQSPTTHYIKWGDTLAKIAYRYYGDGKLYPELAEINKIKNPHLIVSGKTLLLPHIKKEGQELVDMTTEFAKLDTDIKPPPSLPSEAELNIASPSATEFNWRKIENNAFGVGEKLKFHIKWQFITAGVATMNIDEIVQINGRSAYKIVSEARSTPFIDTFFKVRDTNISFMDVESVCSHKFESNIQEGGYKKYEFIEFDQINNVFKLSDGKTGSTRPYVQDVFSSLYYARLQNLEDGGELTVDTHSGDKTYPLIIKVHKKEKIRVPAGEFECYKLEPRLKGEGIFKAKGKLLVWVTADQRRMPVLMKSEVFIGSVDAVLVEYNTVK